MMYYRTFRGQEISVALTTTSLSTHWQHMLAVHGYPPYMRIRCLISCGVTYFSHSPILKSETWPSSRHCEKLMIAGTWESMMRAIILLEHEVLRRHWRQDRGMGLVPWCTLTVIIGLLSHLISSIHSSGTATPLARQLLKKSHQ